MNRRTIATRAHAWQPVSCWAAACVAMLTATTFAQASPSVEELLARAGERIAEYYRRAQNVICTEKSTVQPIGRDFSPVGFARVAESELHIEWEAGDANSPGEAKVVRELRKVNGRPPRDKDKKDRAGCTDPNPLTTEPLAFLLPAHRSEYRFTLAGLGKGKDRNTLLIDFTLIASERKPELMEDERGHDDCFDWSGPLAAKGRVWVEANSYDVLRLERRTLAPVDVRVPIALQRRHDLADRVTIEREDLTIRYKTFAFHDPDEAMLLPESIEELVVVRGGLQSTRRSQVFSGYRRFMTGARIVK